jgi:hypothetical protein
MHIKKLFCAAMFVLLCFGGASAQEVRREGRIGFRVNRINIDPSFRKNRESIKALQEHLDEIKQDTTVEFAGISFRGVASPEGSEEWNRYLAKNRRLAIERIVMKALEIPDSLVKRDPTHISWSDLRECVAASNMNYKDEVIEIIDGDWRLVPYHNGRKIDSRVVALRRLHGGTVWREMFNRYFMDLRYANVVMTASYKPLTPFFTPVFGPYLTTVEPPTGGLTNSPPHKNPWLPQLHLKTNALGWALLQTNLAIEVDICRHLSFHLPVYYSAWNYFTETIKFRTFALYPELRAWFNGENEKWFLGAHFGFAYYNYAFNGALRYQDHYMKTPAKGGGLSLGYRMPISKDERWKVEFSLGVGYYPLYYDTFHNYNNGKLIESYKKNYLGLDQASISFSYAIDLRKRGGKHAK